jgi:hypothetical protein
LSVVTPCEISHDKGDMRPLIFDCITRLATESARSYPF